MSDMENKVAKVIILILIFTFPLNEIIFVCELITNILTFKQSKHFYKNIFGISKLMN